MESIDPEIQKLTAIYGREAQSFDIRIAQIGAAPACAQRFLAITAKFREVLQLHARMLTRVKNASGRHDPAPSPAKSSASMRRRAPMGPQPGYRAAVVRGHGVQPRRLILRHPATPQARLADISPVSALRHAGEASLRPRRAFR